eukprot:scaffold56111_cov44-Attheya_sp.AAC.1
MISSRSSRNGSSTSNSMLATVCSSALLLIALLGNHHVTAQEDILSPQTQTICRCAEIEDPCTALLLQPVLVRATIHNETKVGNNYYYDAIVKTIYVNAQIHVEEGQTITIRAGGLGSRRQSDVSPAVVPKSVLHISRKLTKEERQAAKKIAKEAKQAANQAARKKMQAENKALRKAQKKDVTTISEACP